MMDVDSDDAGAFSEDRVPKSNFSFLACSCWDILRFPLRVEILVARKRPKSFSSYRKQASEVFRKILSGPYWGPRRLSQVVFDSVDFFFSKDLFLMGTYSILCLL